MQDFHANEGQPWLVSVLYHIETVLKEKEKRTEDRFREKDNRDQQRFDAQQKAVNEALVAAEKAVNAALTAAKEAVVKAEISQQRVNEGQNEFRGTLKDQATALMPRAETELLVSQLRGAIQESRDSIATIREAGSAYVGRDHGIEIAWGVIMAVGSVVLSTAAIILHFVK